jgi:hypothetical protein
MKNARRQQVHCRQPQVLRRSNRPQARANGLELSGAGKNYHKSLLVQNGFAVLPSFRAKTESPAPRRPLH